MKFQASMHQTEKTLKSALRQNRPYPPYSFFRHTAQKQLTNKKKEGGRVVKKGMHFMFLV